MALKRLDFEVIDEFNETQDEEIIDDKPVKKKPVQMSFADIRKRYSKYGEFSWPSEDSVDAKYESLRSRSEKEYSKVAKLVVNASVNQLKTQNESKAKLKSTFTTFFIIFVSIQYIALLALFAVNIFLPEKAIPNELIIAYMSSIFVETLGVIILMIKYAFDSSQETNVLDILNGVISNYQKFDGDESVPTNEEKNN